MTDDQKQSQAQQKFAEIMKVDSPQKPTNDENMVKWLEVLKKAGVARLEWKSYFSDDQVYFDDYDLWSAEDDYITDFPYAVINGDGLDGYLEELQGALYAMNESGHYILDVASGSVTRIEDIYEESERVEDPVEHEQYAYNVETKQWTGPIYPEIERGNPPYYVQIKLHPNEKRDYRNQIVKPETPIGETDRWETIDGEQRYLESAINDALVLRNDGNYDTPRHTFSSRVVDRLGNILFVASLLGTEWDIRAPFSVRWVNKADPTDAHVTKADIDSFVAANEELLKVQQLLKDTNTHNWIAQILDNKGEAIKHLYASDAKTFIGIRESSKRMYEVEVAEGREFLPPKGRLAEVEPEDLYSFASYIKSLADWSMTCKFGLKSFGDKAVEFEIDAHAESDDQGGSYWSIDDLVARDKDGVTLSRLPSIEAIQQMIDSGEVQTKIDERKANRDHYVERLTTHPKDNNQYMIDYYSEPLFAGEISMDNMAFTEWAEQYIDDQWNDDLGGNVSFNPDMYVYRVDQPPLYNGKFDNARFFVWTPEMTDAELKLKQDYAVAYIRKLAETPAPVVEKDDDGEDVDVSGELPF